MEILISIKHKYAESIYKGTKLFELRKVAPKVPKGTKCYIYEPLPIGKVTGCFIYGGVTIMYKMTFWEYYRAILGMTYGEYFKYYENHEKIHAWRVVSPIRFGQEYTLKEIGHHAPQSYTIISK